MLPAESIYGTYLGISLLYVLCYLILVHLFILRRHLQPISSRNIILSLISCTMGIVHFVFLAINLGLAPFPQDQSWSCYLVLISSTLLLPLWGLPYYLRCFEIIYMYFWNVEKLNSSIVLAKAKLRKTESNIYQPILEANKGAGDDDKKSQKEDEAARETTADESESNPSHWYFSHRRFLSDRWIYGTLAIVCLIHLIATIISELTTKSNAGSEFQSCISDVFIPFAIFAAIYLVILVIIVVRMWKVRDAYFIKTEMRAVLFVELPLYITWFICYVITVPPNFQPAWFPMVGDFLTLWITIGWPVYLSTKKYWYVGDDLIESESTLLFQFTRTSRISMKRDSKDGRKSSASSALDSSPLSSNSRGKMVKVDMDEINKRTPSEISKADDDQNPTASRAQSIDSLKEGRTSTSKKGDKEKEKEKPKLAPKSSANEELETLKEDSLIHYLLIPAFQESFERFCVQAWCIELILFFKDVKAYQELPSSERLNEAKHMYDLYLTLDGLYEVENVKESTNAAIKQAIESGNVTGDLFKEAFGEVYEQMRSYIFPIWRRSDGFKKLLEVHKSRQQEGKT